MFIRSHLCAGEQRRRVDEIVEIVDDDGAVLFEERVPRGGGAGQLARMGDDISFRPFGAAGAQHQDGLAIGNRPVKGRGETARFLGCRFDVSGDHVDLRTVSLIVEIIGGVQNNLVAAAGADVKAQMAFRAGVDQQIHHAAALKDAADVTRAEILRQLAAPDAELGADRNEPHAIGSKQFYARRFGGVGQLLLQLLSHFAALGETVGENDSRLDAFFTRLPNDRRDSLVIDGDDGQGNLTRNIENAWISFQSENFRAAGVDRHDAGRIESHGLQIFEYIDRVMIAVAGADNGKTVGFEEWC